MHKENIHVHLLWQAKEGLVDVSSSALPGYMSVSLGVCSIFANSEFCFEFYCSKVIKVREPAFYKTHSSIAPIWELFPFLPWQCKGLHKFNYIYLLCISISLSLVKSACPQFRTSCISEISTARIILARGKEHYSYLTKESISQKHILQYRILESFRLERAFKLIKYNW